METGALRRVLIADDAHGVALRLAERLGETGRFEIVGPAFDGARALELFAAARPSAAVLDLVMPRATGLDVLKTIRAAGDPCLVLIITSQADASARDRCLAAGADHFLQKPEGFETAVDILLAHFVREVRPT